MNDENSNLLEIKLPTPQTFKLVQIADGLWSVDEPEAEGHFDFFELSDAYVTQRRPRTLREVREE